MVVKYTDPGVYVTELYQPKAGIVPGVGFALGLIATGSKSKNILNESVIRGKIYGEILTVGSTPGSHTATLDNTSDGQKGNTTLYKDGAVLPTNAYVFTNTSVITIADSFYSGTSIYTMDYVAPAVLIDNLDNTPTAITKAGLFLGSSNFKEGKDFQFVGYGYMNWDILTPATITGLNNSFDLSSLNRLYISLDGHAPVTVDLTGDHTANDIAADINNTLSYIYGADYSNVADGSTGYVVLTCPNLDPYAGNNSIITLYSGTNSALNIVFGLAEVGAPYQYRGVGRRPLPGQTYYVSYTMDRPDTDYNVVRHFLTDTSYYADLGLPVVGNDLSLLGQLAWTVGVSEIYIIQVKDGDDDGVYTEDDYIVALGALIDQRNITEIVVGSSTANIRARVLEILQTECSLDKSNYKGYWCGAPIGTSIGDIDTADSFVYIAQEEFGITPDDAARGRIVLTAPANWTYNFVDAYGVSQTITVDSNYISAVLASAVVCKTHASDTLFRNKFSELVIENDVSGDFEYSDSERRFLSENGVNVMVMEGGSALVFDSTTTDTSGDARYEEPSVRTQKDNLSFQMIATMNKELIGVVPDSPLDFVGMVKGVIGTVLLAQIEAGNIGYFTQDDMVTIRDIDYNKDIVVYRTVGDPTKYIFKYWFNARYPVKRMEGYFSVDSPFAVTSGT